MLHVVADPFGAAAGYPLTTTAASVDLPEDAPLIFLQGGESARSCTPSILIIELLKLSCSFFVW